MMKVLILTCFLSLCTLGRPSNPMLSGINNGHAIGPLTNETFLTSFVKGDQLYLNIPDGLLDVPMLFVCYGNKRRSYMQVVWSLHNNKILLKRQSIQSTSGITLPFKKGLALGENLLAMFPLENMDIGQGGRCINITDLILRQELEWPQKLGVSFGNHVPQISLVVASRNLDKEVVVKVLKGQVKGGSKIAEPVFYGFSTLPDPMRARRFDYRMGFYDEESTRAHFWQKNTLGNITKWRLEKKHKDRTVSDPVKPITFILSPGIPRKWRPYIRAGIEEWLPAFESAGFSNALVVKEVDSLDEWQAHSIQTNLVYWSQEKYLRGTEYEDYGGTIAKVIDLRSGEILRGDIYMGASARTVAEKYFVRAAPLDHRAQKFPFPEELTGRLFQVIAAHEAGHIFGIKDANFGEYSYPWDKMNDSLWLQSMGHTPSIMNYTRSNNIPQPEDSIPPSLLLQKVGPTDRYNIQWAYTEFPEGTSRESEEAALERMVRWQDSVPWYRFNINQLEVMGPAASDEVVESNDPVRSTRLALKNLKRVIEILPEVTGDQNDNARLERLYDKTITLWNDHMKHVLTLVGGYDFQYRSINGPGNPYTPIPLEDQREALDFLLSHAFNAPQWLTDPAFLVGARYSTYPDNILKYQQRLLMELVTARRLKRLEYLEDISGQKNILQAFLAHLQSGLFTELEERPTFLDRRREGIQMTYIDRLIRILEQEKPNIDPDSQFIAYTDTIKGQIMQQLIILKKDIEKKVKKSQGTTANGHWLRCLKKIDSIR